MNTKAAAAAVGAGSAHRQSEPARFAQVDWAQVVTQIQNGDPAGQETLYSVFTRGLKYFMGRQLGSQDLEDRLHEVFIVVVKAIQGGSLREPERLMGFVRTVAKRQVVGQIERAVHARTKEAPLENGMHSPDEDLDPERRAISQQHNAIVAKAMAKLKPRDREILQRFYLREQSQEQICEEMHLSVTQYRLYKSRAKAHFGDFGKQAMAAHA